MPIHDVYRGLKTLLAARALLIFAFLLLSIPACNAQDLLPPSEIPTVTQLIDSRTTHNSLKCEVHPFSPFVDFNFRHEAGLLLSADLNQFRFGEQVVTYTKDHSRRRLSVFLRSSFRLPAPAPGMSDRIVPNDPDHRDMMLGSAFNVGEGHYSVELLLTNQHGASCYRKWTLKIENHSGKSVPHMMSRESVTPVVTDSWDGQLNPNGIRLSVLLDASSVRQDSSQLYPWDRSLLLQALASLLKGVPSRSVRVVAFNLDQQREIFRAQTFDAQSFDKLAKALEGVGLAAVPVQALMRGSQSKFISQLTQEQTTATDPPNAIVFLGPQAQANQSTTAQPPPVDPVASRFFYLEFHPVGAHFPDSIEYLTKRFHGSIFGITSPNDLASAIRKIAAQLAPAQ